RRRRRNGRGRDGRHGWNGRHGRDGFLDAASPERRHPDQRDRNPGALFIAKQIMFDESARAKMRAGIEKLAKTVRVTLGPAGRNVILSKSFGAPSVTKDGVSVVRV